MFGLTHKISDSSLYLLHDMAEGMLQNAQHILSETPVEKVHDIEKYQIQVAYYKQELEIFKNDIEEQRNRAFQFSKEELYINYGQYDKFVGVVFHKFSPAAEKFGRNIGGIFIYDKSERKDLEAIISSDNIQRTCGFVKMDVSSKYPLSDEQVKELKEVGFSSGDIYEISSSISTVPNKFAQKVDKEIPNRYNLKVDFFNVDQCKLELYTLNMILKCNRSLIKSEWDKYYGYNLFYYPEIKENKILADKIFNEDGTIKKEVRFYELIAKKLNKEITKIELQELSILLRNRRIERFDILKTELKKAGIRSLSQFKAIHPDIYLEIYLASLTFEDDVLSNANSTIPIYWDFKSFLHINLRHCLELQPDGPYKAKTPFSYKQKDIQRILKLAIEQLEDKIQTAISQGRAFSIYGEKALYFNGDYYYLKIDSNGSVASFYPYKLYN